MGKRVKGKTGKKKYEKRVPPSLPEPAHPDHLRWRLDQLEFEDPFGWASLLACDCDELRRELIWFENEKLSLLKRSKRVKPIPLKDMTVPAQRRLAELNRTDPEGLWQLHLDHYPWRVYGYLEGSDFSFFWWDPYHDVATGESRHRSN